LVVSASGVALFFSSDMRSPSFTEFLESCKSEISSAGSLSTACAAQRERRRGCSDTIG
jgi:hypothetical protein